jgi:antitoxin VapB
MSAKPPPVRAKLFKNGRSQAVRLPKEFRFSGSEVTLRRAGDSVIMEPVRKRDWPDGYWARLARGRHDARVGKLRIGLKIPDADES